MLCHLCSPSSSPCLIVLVFTIALSTNGSRWEGGRCVLIFEESPQRFSLCSGGALLWDLHLRMPLEYLLQYRPAVSGHICDFLTKGEIYRGALSNSSVFSSWCWITACESNTLIPSAGLRKGIEGLPLEISERLHLYLSVPEKLETSAASLTTWKQFAIEFSLSPQTCLSCYLDDPIIKARTE